MTGAHKRALIGFKTAAALVAFAAGMWVASAPAAGDNAASRPAPPATAAAETVTSAGVPLSMVPRPDVIKLPGAPTTPKTVADLKLIQARVEAVVKMALPATVSIQFSYAQGSGVLVSKDGYVLTAGHVSGTPGATMQILLSNGKMVHAKSLGADNGIDSGMVKIVETPDKAGYPDGYPFVPVGTAKKLAAGQWVVALGHPGGYVRGRPPVVRLGRVLIANSRFIGTDGPLISGDSGGPLFDLDGRLIGINSRIGETTTQNLHVPIDTFVEHWDRLAKGDEWGGGEGFFDFRRGSPPAGATLGVTAFEDDKGAKLTVVHPGTPAERGGLQAGDIVTKFNDSVVKTPEDLAELVGKKKPGDTVTLAVLRESKAVKVSVKLGGSIRR